MFYLQRADEVKGFLEALPADYAYLVPKLELYKPKLNTETGELIDKLVYMPDYTLAKHHDGELDDPQTSRDNLAFDDPDDPVIYSSQMGINCGITSFTFDETQKNMGFSSFQGIWYELCINERF